MSLDKVLYNFARRQKTAKLGLTGEAITVGGGTSVSVLLRDGSDDVLYCSGTTVPTAATDGYAKGCIFIKTDAGAGVGGVYVNVGTSSSSAFALMSPASFVAANATVVAWAATDTSITANEISGYNNTNTGSSDTVSLTLPAAATMIGRNFRVQVTVAQIVQLLPQTGEAICLGGSTAVSKYLQIAGVIGNYCDVYCDGTRYHVTNYSGVVTKEA